jgi:streptomycin 6-kinase
VVRWTGPAYRLRPNLVVPVATADGAARVLKVCAADLVEPGDYAGERDALRHFAGLADDPAGRVRAVRLYDADDDLRTLELEHVRGVPLDTGWPQRRDDAQLTADLALVLRTLWAIPAIDTAPFRPLEQWMRALEQPSPGVEDRLRRRAAGLARELRAEAFPAAVVLHGDLHHENVIAADTGDLVVLDPKGIYGAPGFDVGALLWNPLGVVVDHPHVLPARLDVLSSELGMDRATVRAWAWVGCILSAVWEADGGPFAADPGYPLAVAELLSRA